MRPSLFLLCPLTAHPPRVKNWRKHHLYKLKSPKYTIKFSCTLYSGKQVQAELPPSWRSIQEGGSFPKHPEDSAAEDEALRADRGNRQFQRPGGGLLEKPLLKRECAQEAPGALVKMQMLIQ